MSVFWAVLLIFVLAGCWFLTVLGLPGNWGMVGAAALFAGFVPKDSAVTLGWTLVVVLVVLACVGELLEFLAGAIGVAQAKGSKRSAVLAVCFSILGSFVGLATGIPIPVVGSLVAVVFFSGVGALVGAMIGELWKGRSDGEAFRVGHSAFWGRILGTVSKILVGSMMVAVAIGGLVL